MTVYGPAKCHDCDSLNDPTRVQARMPDGSRLVFCQKHGQQRWAMGEKPNTYAEAIRNQVRYYLGPLEAI
jgi:hypothetical protein